MKKLLSLLLILACVSSMIISCGNSTAKEAEFYDLTQETYELLDDVAQEIYDYWYACIYDDEFESDINYAIQCALDDNADTVDKIDENTAVIENLFNQTKDGNLKKEVRAVMEAFNDYYFLIFESNCSFNEYSDQRNPLKQALSTALKNLSYEI